MAAGVRRIISGSIVLCVLLITVGAGASSAFGARTYDSEITGAGLPHRTGGTLSRFRGALRIAFTDDDELWVIASLGLYKYDAYPSQTYLGPPPDLSSVWSGFGQDEFTLAVDNATGRLFVVSEISRTVYSFEDNGAALPPWDASFGQSAFGQAAAGIWIAIDNSPTDSAGRLYLSLRTPENAVEVFDTARRPVDFSASAPYIKDNELTGTPNGPFGAVGYVAVDSKGNIYVVDQAKATVEQFDSSGTFIQTFDGAGAPGGFTLPEGERVPDAVAIDPTNGNVLIETENEFHFKQAVSEFDASGNYLSQITADPHGVLWAESLPLDIEKRGQGDLRVNSHGYLYLPAGQESGEAQIDIFSPNPAVPDVEYGSVSSPTATTGTLHATVDPNGGGEVSSCRFEYGFTTSYGSGQIPCEPATHFSDIEDVSAELSGLAVETTYHYRLVVENASGIKYGEDQIYTPHRVLGLTTDPATAVSESGATLNAAFVGNGEATDYRFEWGRTAAYGDETNEAIVSPGAGDSEQLSVPLIGLAPYSTYHFRVVASNGAGTSYGADQMFTTTAGIPSVRSDSVSQVHSDRAVLESEVNPNGADTTYRFEYVTAAEFEQSGFENATHAPASEVGVGRSKHFQGASILIDGLTPATSYRYRTVAINQSGVGVSSIVRTFTTFDFGFNDTCPNSHVRQQTGAALLLDCRAYELVSAANAGGYDVESDLVAGQTPYGGYPLASNPSRLLYGVHDGAIPGTGQPTNHGLDPYVATRGETGWKTRYVGIPAAGTPSDASFASTLAEADSRLGTFAFGGADLCSPCFADGSVGMPVHLPSGELVQGMAGSIPQPAAQPAGFVGAHFSADGNHFVFSSESQFEPDGNSNGDVSIYDRDLVAEETRVVSRTPGGTTMTGSGIGEIAISANGSRILVGRLVSEEGGARHWHLYMNVGDADTTIDLTPGTVSGTVFAGMTADGSRVFFTTPDQLTGEDEDSSADLYEVDVSETDASLRLVSAPSGAGQGDPGDSDLCHPTANTIHPLWNTSGSTEDCSVVAVGGGGGVAAATGTVYFLSPELLDGASGVVDAPNLYASAPGGSPRFVATLESDDNAPLPAATHSFVRSFGAFLRPGGVAIDHATGDIYAIDITSGENTGTVQKLDSTGHLLLGFGGNGKITVSGALGNLHIPAQIAVDNAPGSPSHGDLYVPSPAGEVVKKFDSSGASIADLSVPGRPSAVAVDQTNGNVYVTSSLGSRVYVFGPTGTPIKDFPTISFPTGVAVDSSGKIYVVNGEGFFGNAGTTEAYDSSGNHLKQLDGNPSKAVAVDPADDHVYVDEGSRVIEFDTAGNQVGPPVGSGKFQGSFSLAVDHGTLVVSNPSLTNLVVFGPSAIPAEPRTDNPLVIDSVSTPEVRRTADFQVTPSGEQAAFTSTLPLTEYDNAEVHREIFRFDSETGIDCASCNPTGERASGEASLPANGLGLSDDGRVFFNSDESLVDRDLNERLDAYEWKSGKGIELISPGTSPFASSLLGISADGIDAYFFTHDTLVPADQNGSRVKVYDARTQGGYPIVPAAVPCKASDECHGPGTEAPPAPAIKTIAGTPVGNAKRAPTACKRGFVKRRGKCVRKHTHRKRHRHSSRNKHKAAAPHRHGGGK
jgi:DNA-binding beta-propeller fold protein YncE